MRASMARCLFQLIEPIAVVTHMAPEPTEAVRALGLVNPWDAYFAGREAPLGRDIRPEVVHAIFYNFAEDPCVSRAADLLNKAGASAPTEGRPLHAAVRTLPVSTAPIARLWHGANLLREHRGDGHVAALLSVGIAGTEAHVLHALSEGTSAGQFGRLSPLPTRTGRRLRPARHSGQRSRARVDCDRAVRRPAGC